MLHRFSRTELLIGQEGLDRLAASKVAVFGVGGVGSYTAEALARAGIGHLVLVDHDDVCLTNINRQLHALQSTVGKPKVELMKERVQDINPRIQVDAIREFYTPENGGQFFARGLDYVVDAIDNVTGKLDLIERSLKAGVPVISAMGAGNKLDPTRFRVADISETSVDPLARVIRKELRQRGITGGVKVVYSEEPPLTPRATEIDCKTACICTNKETANCTLRRQIPGSISFVPSVAGLIMAGEVVRDLLGMQRI
ncbi:tRNA threonylcarbamoyladenosine dehydratase [Thermincola potens]|uniref:UBA/THIF-type NAD/FAD binding protein n=1 Tax=Thermincola potens (strain JR) TaxID=635013 RepID=D5X851_THEPJ|nr:tRNA threonylcarbamoyladenosine dehydratase [Thermincola potens]ADG82771.1 UBA/THIF-type NAD/FAD binding protein [Thermincola potens JR]